MAIGARVGIMGRSVAMDARAFSNGVSAKEQSILASVSLSKDIIVVLLIQLP